MKNKSVFIAVFLLIVGNLLQAQISVRSEEADKFLIMENYKAALDIYKTVLTMDTSSQSILFKAGLACEGLQKLDSASIYFEKAAQISPVSPGILLASGRVCYSQGKISQAVKFYKIILESDSCNTGANRALAKMYYEMEQYDSARTFYLNLLKNDTLNAFLNRQVGNCYMKLKELEKSALYFRRAYSMQKDDASSLAQLSIICLLLDQQQQAQKYAESGIEQFPENSVFYKIAGDIQYSGKHYEKASVLYRKAVLKGDRSAYCYMKLGLSIYWHCVKADTLNYSQKDSSYTKALDALQSALETDSLNPVVWYFLGNVNKEMGKMQVADTCYSQMIRLSIPSFIADAYLSKAECNEATYRYDEMVDSYEKAYFYRPYQKDILLKLAVFYENKMKNPEKAVKYYRQYIETSANPNDRMTLIIKKKLETLSKTFMNR